MCKKPRSDGSPGRPHGCSWGLSIIQELLKQSLAKIPSGSRFDGCKVPTMNGLSKISSYSTPKSRLSHGLMRIRRLRLAEPDSRAEVALGPTEAQVHANWHFVGFSRSALFAIPCSLKSSVDLLNRLEPAIRVLPLAERKATKIPATGRYLRVHRRTPSNTLRVSVRFTGNPEATTISSRLTHYSET